MQVLPQREQPIRRLFPPPRPCYPPPVLRTQDTPPANKASSPSEDELLVRAVAAGDREALGTLYDRFAPSMLAVAQRIVGSAREAEDLVQDVFLEAWQRARHYDATRGSVRTWLMLRVRSRGLDRLRVQKRAPTVDVESAQLSQRGAQEEDTFAARDGRVLHGALAELAQDQRAVLELAYFGGYSCSEIALRLEIPIGTVKSRMSRAIEGLRNKLSVREGGRP
jgi:RNA polymerase sigma-70 factor (ECF subfamily)